MTTAPASSGVRLSEMVAALSLATDLGLGLPQEHVLRQTMISRRLADAADLDPAERSAVFYVSLLAWVGCVSDSHELAKWFGDDLMLRADSYTLDKVGMPMMRFMLAHVGAGAPPLQRLGTIGRFLTVGVGEAAKSMLSHCQTTGDLADRLGLDGAVRRSLQHAFERWDGKGVPGDRAGEEIPPAMRVVQIADDAEVFHRVGGVDAVVEMLRSRRGTEFDPALVDVFCARAPELLDGLDGDRLDRGRDFDSETVWHEVADTGLSGTGVSGTGLPAAGRSEVEVSGTGARETELSEVDFTEVLRAFGDYADLKSPWWLGHSAGVAALAADAAARLGLPAADVTLVERAALVHDLGAIGVSTGIWDKSAPLSPSERERVRTHPYLMERTLARPSRLAEIGALAGLHHERLDGSGYPKGLQGEALPLPARLLAAADVYHALGEPRPYRGPLPAADAAAALRVEAVAGRLDGDAVNAVLAAAGHRVRRRPANPAGLTPREVEVLVLLARGRSNRQIAAELMLSPRTVGSHVEHVYTKIGVSTRGAAAMFAMRHGLVGGADRSATNV
jgi:HD-GYP domain-containing protein (c-di-GMP phosphodiesterase class II)